ncbi:MAG: hypothetical protein RBQ97_01705 [Acholeplasma sp.]|nr:hypothetical protein [Acholeplasma sp.]
MAVNNKLYAWGSNEKKAVNESEDAFVTSPYEITYFKDNDITIKDVIAGFNNSYILTEGGEVYSWGFNNNRQLGHGKGTFSSPKKVESLSGVNIVDVQTQYYGVIMRTSDNELIGFGRDVNGELGSGVSGIHGDFVKVAIPNGVTVLDYSAGMYHGMFLSTDNDLYVWGYNGDGQLGLGDLDRRLTPVKNELASVYSIRTISSSVYSSSSIITEDNSVYNWGLNGYTKLGFGDWETVNVPKKMKDSPINNARITNISVGKYHTFLEDEEGRIYGVGSNEYGEMGFTTGTVVKLNNLNKLSLQLGTEKYILNNDLLTFNIDIKKIMKVYNYYLDEDYSTIIDISGYQVTSDLDIYIKWIWI